jgi:cytochrome P450
MHDETGEHTMVALSTQEKEIPFLKQENPLMGSLLEHNRDRLNFYMRLWQEHGNVVGFHFGPFPGVAFFAPEQVRSILVEHGYDFDKGVAIHTIFRAVVGDGIFSSEGEFHRRQRKIMAPPFQPRHIVSYADTMVRYSEQIQRQWQDGEKILINHAMTDLTMSIIGKVLFDADVFKETDELGNAFTVMFSYVGKELTRLIHLPLGWPLPGHAQVRTAARLLQDRLRQMIRERRMRPLDERNDVLSLLLRARYDDGSAMDEDQIIAEALTLFGAGHETTAVALTWAWYLLTQNPERYRKMRQEVDTVLQGRSPTYDDLAQLPYTVQVFKEALRLYPPAYAFTRTALKDVLIDGYRVRKNTVALMAPWVMHRNPEHFPDPERFEPERFGPEHEKLIPRYAFLPFGAGPRICLGNHFAMMEGPLLLATLAQRVSFEFVPGQQVLPDPSNTLTLRPRDNVSMIVRRRV